MNCRKETYDINRQSTLPLRLRLFEKCSGDTLPIDTNFRLIFFGSKSGNNRFHVSQKDGEMENCYVENGGLFMRLENHNLQGLLVYENWRFFKDKNAEAGRWQFVSTENAMINGKQINIT